MLRPVLFASVASVAAVSAAAQNTTAPPVITLPGVQNYSLPPGTPTPTPTPAPTAAPTPTIVPPPLPLPPVARPTATPTPARARAATPSPTPTPTPSAVPTQEVPAAPLPASAATPAVEPTAVAPVAPEAPAAEQGEASAWPWLAGGVLVLLAGAGWFLWRRRSMHEPEEEAYAPIPAPPPPPPPVAPTAASAPPPAAAAPTVELRPIELATQGPDALLRFELLLRNDGAVPLEGVRPVVVLGSAGPELANQIARFHAAAPTMSAAAQFDLPPGEARRLTGELILPGTAMHVTEVNDRAMIVPVVLVDLRWRGGLSIRADGVAFLIGTGSSETAKLGPIWVDRSGQRFTRLDARRFNPESRG